MKKYRRALALVSFLSLCSLVWCVASAARGFPWGREPAEGKGSRLGHTPKSSRLQGAGLRGP